MTTPTPIVCDNCGATNALQAIYCSACGHALQAGKPAIYDSTTGRLLANITLKQRYHIIAPAGRGGMGAVYRAEDTQLGNRSVALKEMSQNGLSPQEKKGAADAFRQEAIILARLNHPNLPSIFDHFEENGRWYLVMSFIEGETLADYFDQTKDGKLPLDEVLQIGIQLCTVLGYLHNQQPAIIFRDLKPTNIMRTTDGHIYLIDFGIARHFKPDQARDTAYYGSMGYAPPEQYGWAQTTPRADIYSLGATLYQCISGHKPSSTPFRFPALQSLVPTIPARLETLVTQMLELDVDKRPASVLLIKQGLQTLASVPNSSTKEHVISPAEPDPEPPVTDSTHLTDAPVPPAPRQETAAKPVNTRAFGKRQVVTMLILTVCYGLFSYEVVLQLVSRAPDSTVFNFEVGFLLLVPIFLAADFGSWIGAGVTGIGFFLAYFIGGPDYQSALPWWGGAIFITLTFCVGLARLKTQGRYSKFGNILFVWLIGLLSIGIHLALVYFITIVMQGIPGDLLGSYLSSLWPLILPTSLLLPLLLLVSNAIRRRA